MKEISLFDIMKLDNTSDGEYMNIEKEKIGRLIEQIQGGDKEAFGELYRLTSPKAYFVAFQIVRNEQDAEDILQETYIKVLDKIDEIDPAQSFMGWLYRVVSNKSKNLLKKKNMLIFEAYEEESFEEIPDDTSKFNPEESLNQEEICREVMAAIDELSDEKRVCVVMKYFSEMTVSEIAESLEVPESTVKNRLYAARKDLKTKFEKNGNVFYGAALGGVLVWALSKTSVTASAAFLASAASAEIAAGAAGAYTTGASATATTAASAGVGTAAKIAVASVTQKIAVGVAATAVIGGSTAGVVTVVKNNNTHHDSTTTLIEEVTTAPSQTAEYVFEHITETEILISETECELESTTPKKQTVRNTSTTKRLTTEQSSSKLVTTKMETTTKETITKKVTTTGQRTTAKQETTTKQETTDKQETTTQTESTTQAETATQAETTTQPSTTETTVQQVATLIIEVTDMDDNVVDTLTLPVDAGTEMTWDYLITLISQNGYEAMAGVYGDGVGAVAQAGEIYTFTAEL